MYIFDSSQFPLFLTAPCEFMEYLTLDLDANFPNRTYRLFFAVVLQDEAYDVYDAPFQGERATSIYKPGKTVSEEFTEEDLAKLKSTDRFRPDKGFSGAEGKNQRSGAVQFEKHVEGDVFGLDQFIAQARDGERKRGRSALFRNSA